MLKPKAKKTLSVFLLCFSIAATEPAWNYRQASLAAPVSGYEITRNTLDHLQREGFSKALTEMLSPILNTPYLNLKDFLDALPIQLTKKESDILMRYASTQQIKIQAEEFSSDLNENAAVFRGNVKGVIPRENIELTTAKLRLVSGKGKNFEKLIGEGGVQVKQWDREVRSDFAIYTQIDLDKRVPDTDSTETKTIITPQQTLQLQGNVIMKANQGSVLSKTVLVDILRQYATLEGQDTSKEGRIKVEANLSELETNRKVQNTEIKTQEVETEKQEKPEQKKVLLLASSAVLDNIKHLAMFEGDVEMERTPDNLYIHAGKITLHGLMSYRNYSPFVQNREYVLSNRVVLPKRNKPTLMRLSKPFYLKAARKFSPVNITFRGTRLIYTLM